MTVEIIDNFMSYQSINDMEPVYALNDPGATTGSNLVLKPGNGPTFVSGQPQSPRTAPPTLSFLGNSNSGGGNATEVRLALPATVEKIIAFTFRPVAGEGNTSSQADSNDQIFATYDDTNFQVAMNMLVQHSDDLFDAPEPTGGVYLYLRRSVSTVLWDSFNDRDSTSEVPGMENGFMLYGSWYYIELRILADASNGEVELRINGVQVFDGTGIQTTIGQPNIGFVEFRSGEASGSNSYGSGLEFDIADVISIDTAAGFVAFPFPAIIDRLEPDADTIEADFAPNGAGDNFVEVDDAPHDFDTTFNESTTVGHKDRFTTAGVLPFANLGNVLAVKVEALVKDTLDLTTRQVRAVVFENATEAQGATRTLTETPYQPVQAVFDDNPDTSLPWTKAEVAAAEFGYEIIT
jgi:hypothetical protein